MGQVVIRAIATVWNRGTLVRVVKRKHVFMTWDATTWDNVDLKNVTLRGTIDFLLF